MPNAQAACHSDTNTSANRCSGVDVRSQRHEKYPARLKAEQSAVTARLSDPNAGSADKSVVYPELRIRKQIVFTQISRHEVPNRMHRGERHSGIEIVIPGCQFGRAFGFSPFLRRLA
jgi:hypothetical protein